MVRIHFDNCNSHTYLRLIKKKKISFQHVTLQLFFHSGNDSTSSYCMPPMDKTQLATMANIKICKLVPMSSIGNVAETK